MNEPSRCKSHQQSYRRKLKKKMRNKNKFCDNKPQFLSNPQTPPSTTDSEIEYNTQVAR